MLQGVIEMDESYLGGRPRKTNKGKSTTKKRGRGTDKLQVIGAVERGGRAVAKPSKWIDSFTLSDFLRENVHPASALMTDSFPAYKDMGDIFETHLTIDHSVQYVDGIVHTNTIEGLWSLIKRQWHGTHHHYSKRYAALYISELVYKYNARKLSGVFERFVRQSIRVQA